MSLKQSRPERSEDAMKDCTIVEINREECKNLPHDVLPLFLMLLPWWSNLKLRRVCKAWNSVLCNQTLLSQLPPTQHPTGSFCCIMKNRHGCMIVHSSVKHWHDLPSSQIFPKLIASDTRFEVTSATSGLLLISSSYEGLARYLVNPLNGTQRELPPLPMVEDGTEEWTEYFTSRMMADGDNVKLVLVHYLSSRRVWRICIYDLLTDSWNVISDNLQSPVLQQAKIINFVMVGNDLYVLIRGNYPLNAHSVFKVSGNILTEVPVGRNSFRVPIVRLFQHRGSLMIVRGSDGKPPIMDIWRLDPMNRKWRKVASMPNKLLHLFYTTSENVGDTSENVGDFFTFDAEGDYICLSNGHHLRWIVVYNVAEQLWGHLSYRETGKDAPDQEISPDVYIWQPRLDVVL